MSDPPSLLVGDLASESPAAEMVAIAAGTFAMGDSFGEGLLCESPVHTVFVSAFYMDRYEVTKALWDEVATWTAANGYDIGPADGFGKAADHPVNVSWYGTVKWANARSEWEGLTPCYTVGGTVARTGQSVPDDDPIPCLVRRFANLGRRSARLLPHVAHPLPDVCVDVVE